MDFYGWDYKLKICEEDGKVCKVCESDDGCEGCDIFNRLMEIEENRKIVENDIGKMKKDEKGNWWVI